MKAYFQLPATISAGEAWPRRRELSVCDIGSGGCGGLAGQQTIKS